MQNRRPKGVLALSVFFFAGAIISATSMASLLSPEGPLEGIWRLNPRAHEDFMRLGPDAYAIIDAWPKLLRLLEDGGASALDDDDLAKYERAARELGRIEESRRIASLRASPVNVVMPSA